MWLFTFKLILKNKLIKEIKLNSSAQYPYVDSTHFSSWKKVLLDSNSQKAKTVSVTVTGKKNLVKCNSGNIG